MKKLAWLACVVVALLGVRPAHAQVAQTPKELEHVGVNEHLDGPMPLDTPLRDHTGKPVTFRSAFDGKRPVVLQFAYFSCPVVCSMITNNLTASLKQIGWTVGKEYDVAIVSIDPHESVEKTAAKRTSIYSEYGRGSIDGFHFFDGDAASIAALTKGAGFEYQYDARQNQWAHPSVVFILKPDGHVARYLYGLEFPPNDLKLGLLEASEGRSISTVEQIILYCYHYDPQGGKYVLVATRVMQVGGGLSAIVLLGVLGMLWAREFKNAKKNKTSSELAEAAAAKTAEVG